MKLLENLMELIFRNISARNAMHVGRHFENSHKSFGILHLMHTLTNSSLLSKKEREKGKKNQ